MEIKVIGSGCDKCGQLYGNTCEAVKNLNLNARVTKVEDLIEIVMLGVMTVPALMVDGKILSAGRVLKTPEIEKLLRGVQE